MIGGFGALHVFSFALHVFFPINFLPVAPSVGTTVSDLFDDLFDGNSTTQQNEIRGRGKYY